MIYTIFNRPLLNDERKSRFHERKQWKKQITKFFPGWCNHLFFCQEGTYYSVQHRESIPVLYTKCCRNILIFIYLDFFYFFIFYFFCRGKCLWKACLQVVLLQVEPLRSLKLLVQDKQAGPHLHFGKKSVFFTIFQYLYDSNKIWLQCKN